MRITQYRTMLDSDTKHNILVKETSTNYQVDSLQKPESIVQMMNGIFQMEKHAEEYLYMISFDCKMKVLGVFELSHGSVNYSIIGMREVFIRALLSGAFSIVIIHNHPSGDPTPSALDIQVAKKLQEAGEIMGIKLMDSIIIGDKRFISFVAQGII